MKVKVAVLQYPPVFFDKEATLARTEQLVSEYATGGTQLILFPESFIPGYPRGFGFGAVIGSRSAEGRQLYADYLANSIDLESEDRSRLEAIARKNEVYIVIGVTERIGGSLYCSMLYLSPDNGLEAVHRKIKPTGSERLIWGEAPVYGKKGAGAGANMAAVQTGFGKIGGLICWENYMPLARMALYEQGVQLYLAPTADSREVWTSTLRHIALEGRCFVLGCNQYFTKSMYSPEHQALARDEPEEMCPGGSIIVSPLGEVIAGPLVGKAGALVAELDLDDIPRARLDFDVVGHYARPDLFRFQWR
ncbi:carbon-nitrogen hydrolase family protein [Neolewinella aurantiaca]|uniref:Carbon-nitrogen hydrolase family protein n=1 Tax=Neolewinella aurantiaca TaxID=2602767 RepID=A0A5C7G022_9BACT|nr:carbon-nitrogen hydrolase family protein [Neolewinella aurantiaca]TXF91400.1 carbon-nitrogen hydrolase family protein [Neolewinella aurantiaca]